MIEPKMAVAQNEKISLWQWTLLLTALTVIAIGTIEGLRWSKFWVGFESIVLVIVVTIVPLLLIFLASLLWSLLWFKIFGNKTSHKWLKLMVLSPALALLGHGIFTRPTSPQRFEQITGVTFPAVYSDTRFSHFGGGLADHTHTFTFTTTPEETQRLIRELKVTEGDSFSNRNFNKIMERFPGAVFYHRNVESRNWYYDFITDETQTKVWISLWGI